MTKQRGRQNGIMRASVGKIVSFQALHQALPTTGIVTTMADPDLTVKPNGWIKDPSYRKLYEMQFHHGAAQVA